MADATAKEALAFTPPREGEDLPPEAFTHSPVVPVLLAAAAAEAFINELPEGIRMHEPEHVSATLAAVSEALTEIESNNGSVKLKFLVAAQLLGRPFDKGSNPWQDFAKLVELRNWLMHMKPRETFGAGEDGSLRVLLPTLARTLQQKGLALPTEIGVSWLGILHTPQLARWACDGSQAIVNDLLDRIPESDALATVLKWRRFG